MDLTQKAVAAATALQGGALLELQSGQSMKRKYPKSALVGVGGVVIDRDRALLIRRGHEPLKGEWSIPGGMLELGEELATGVRRELKEETGLDVEPLECILVFDRIMREGKRVKYHYVIIDYLCRRKRGRLRPASDVIGARWVRRKDLPRYHLTETATAVILQAFALMGKRR
jgi:ADP-ribose pyrophosphatase YjhB (NUDIX family)